MIQPETTAADLLALQRMKDDLLLQGYEINIAHYQAQIEFYEELLRVATLKVHEIQKKRMTVKI